MQVIFILGAEHTSTKHSLVNTIVSYHFKTSQNCQTPKFYIS